VTRIPELGLQIPSATARLREPTGSLHPCPQTPQDLPKRRTITAIANDCASASATPDALSDYELLEMVLFRALPRRDVKPLAKSLIGRFGSFAEVVHAPDARLREISGLVGSAIIELKLIAATASRVAKGQLQRTVLSSWTAVIDYCRSSVAFADKERFRILFLDKRNQLIADELQQVGTVDHTPVYPREVVKRALELSATSIIMVHNHPSGDPTPSQADIQMTKSISTFRHHSGSPCMTTSLSARTATPV